jgi:sugar/nucleoside kinase (ribokinase family)
MFNDLTNSGDLPDQIDAAMLTELARQVLDMGVAIVAIKLGKQGLYVRTTADPARLAAMEAVAPQAISGWQGRELLSPSFQVHVVGTTGAGDCTIAGLQSPGSWPEF